MVEASKLKLSLRVHRTQHPQTASA
jgi:hypothetical protein